MAREDLSHAALARLPGLLHGVFVRPLPRRLRVRVRGFLLERGRLLQLHAHVQADETERTRHEEGDTPAPVLEAVAAERQREDVTSPEPSE